MISKNFPLISVIVVGLGSPGKRRSSALGEMRSAAVRFSAPPLHCAKRACFLAAGRPEQKAALFRNTHTFSRCPELVSWLAPASPSFPRRLRIARRGRVFSGRRAAEAESRAFSELTHVLSLPETCATGRPCVSKFPTPPPHCAKGRFFRPQGGRNRKPASQPSLFAHAQAAQAGG